MKLNPRAAAISVAAALAAAVIAAPAQANTTLPGVNGKIAFTSMRDFTAPPEFLSQKLLVSLCNDENAQSDYCNREIYSMDPNGANQTRLTNNLDGDDEAAWLPTDGARIAFWSDRQGAEDCGGDVCSSQIWTMGNDGGTPFQVTHGQDQAIHPSYSPDGSKIAYAGLIPEESVVRATAPLFNWLRPMEIYVVPSGGGAVTPLLPAGQTGPISSTQAAFDSYPAWSPDGTQVAFTRVTIAAQPNKGNTTEVFDIRTWVAPSDGSGNAHPVESFPICTVTNGPIPFVTAMNAFATRGLDGLRSAMPRLLATGCAMDVKPAWSPDGKKLAVTRLTIAQQGPQSPGARGFSAAGEDLGDIATFNTDGSGDVNLSDLSEPAACGSALSSPQCAIDEYPAWSPDGTKIAFDALRDSDGTITSCVQSEGACDNEIWTMNADGSGLTQLTSNDGDDIAPDWQRVPPPAVPAQPAAPTPVKPKVGVAGVRRACVARSFHVRFRVSTANSSVKSVVVKLDGHRIKSTKKGSFTLTINSKKLKAGKHRLTITATNAAGQVTTTRKSFSVCKAAKPRRKAAPRFTG